ncbi:MAG: adenylyl-sulfate kinase [archaeon]
MQAKGGTVWFTGLHCSGKTTIANALAEKLRKNGVKLVVLDGDAVRKKISADLGFSREDRNKHIKRVADICELISSNGVLNIACVASPMQEIRDYAKSSIRNFLEIFVKCPLEVCEQRDVKGHYKDAKAKKPGFETFLGINLPYEEPKKPDLVLETDKESVQESAEKLYKKLVKEKWIVE